VELPLLLLPLLLLLLLLLLLSEELELPPLQAAKQRMAAMHSAVLITE